MVWRDPAEQVFYIWRFMVDAASRARASGGARWSCSSTRRAQTALRGDPERRPRLHSAFAFERAVSSPRVPSTAARPRCGSCSTIRADAGRRRLRLLLIGRCRFSPQTGSASRPPRRRSRSSGRRTRPRSCSRATTTARSRPELRLGLPAIADVALAGRGVSARRLEPARARCARGRAPGRARRRRSARAVFAAVRLARARSPRVSSTPRWTTTAAGGTLLGRHPRRRRPVRSRRDRRPRCRPSARARSAATPTAAVHDLPVLVDQIARDRLRADGVRLAPSRAGRGRGRGVPGGLTAPDAALPRHSGLAALERQLADWVDAGLAHRRRTTWTLGLHLDEREGGGSCWSCGCRRRTIPRSACPLRCSGAARTTSSRSSARATPPRPDPPARGARAAAPGARARVRRPDRPSSSSTRTRYATSSARRCPAWTSAACPCCCRPPGSARRHACGSTWQRRECPRTLERLPLTRGAGPLRLAPRGRRHRPLRAGLAELAAAKKPFVRVDGRWQHSGAATSRRRSASSTAGGAARASSTSSAPCPGSGRTRPASSSARSRSTSRSRLCSTQTSAASARCRRRPAMTHPLPFQGARPRLAAARDLGVGAILADDMGLGRPVQAIAMLASEREARRRRARADARRLPDERRQAMGRELHRFAPSLRVHLHHGSARLGAAELAHAAHGHDVVVTSYDIAARTTTRSPRSPGTGCCSTRRRT